VISVVVPVQDAMPWLPEQLAALAAQGCPVEWEVLVADNGSTDTSVEVAEEWAAGDARFRVVDASGRPNQAAARNLAVESARGEQLAFCDADDVVQTGWLSGIASALAHAEVVAGVFDFRSLNGLPPALPQPASTRQLGFLPGGLGANLGVQRRAFEEAGGFAEELPIGEDIDLCWRLQLRGGRFVVAPDAVVAKRDHPRPGGVYRHGLAYGRSGAELYSRHRAEGARPDFVGAARAWLWVAIHLPRLLQAGPGRSEWLHAAGVRIGRLRGSLERRVFFP
jgi:glycosyltransferase involved in cell wall biosynthesis